MRSMKSRLRGFLATLATAALLALLLPAAALAQEDGQEGGAPPLPIVYDGEVYVDGELLQEEAELTVMIGDWESRPATVADGKFEALVVGPPSVAYVGREMTFHLQDLTASQRFSFSLLTEPSFEPLRLDFSRPATAEPTPAVTPEQPTPGPVATPVEAGPTAPDLNIPWVAFGALVAGGAVLVVALNWLARPWLRSNR